MKVPTIINPNIEIARQKLLEKAKQKNTDIETRETAFQGLLFVGNRHETVPLRLLTDKYLSPRAKTAWQLIKLNAYQFQGSAFPSYDELALWLSDRAFQGKATSRKIVSQTLLLLRLTRWLTLCETVRNEQGQVLGNVYVMNDEPLSLMDTLHLSDDYLRLLEKSTRHRDPLVKDVAMAIIDEMLANKTQFWHFISHIGVIQQRYALLQQALPVSRPELEIPEKMSEAVALTQQKLLSSHMEPSENSVELSKKMPESLSSNRELSPSNQAKSLILGRVPMGTQIQYSIVQNIVSTVRYYNA